MIRILCYGDSNTWGYIPGTDHQRYNENERWTKLLQSYLGKKFEIIEEGLNSRTFFSEDKRPGKEGKSGFNYLKPCLETHDKIDIVVLMLGTNELKFAYNNSPAEIVSMLDKFVKFINNFKSQIDKKNSKLIISGIPLVKENEINKQSTDKYYGAPEKSKILCNFYREYCLKNKILYIDNTDLSVGIDGIHLTKEGHRELAEKVFDKILKIFDSKFN